MNSNSNSNGVHSVQDAFVESGKAIDMRLLLSKYLLQYWYLYVIGLVIALTVAYIRLRYSTYQYQVRNTVLIKNPESGSEGLSPEYLLGDLGLPGNSANVQNEMQILKSRTLMEEVVRRLKINTIYEMEGRFKNSEQYLGSLILLDTFALAEGLEYAVLEIPKINDTNTFVLQQGAKTMTIAFGDTVRLDNGMFVFRSNFTEVPPVLKLTIRIVPTLAIAQDYSYRLQIRTAEESSSVLEISLKDPVPQKAADIVNTLIAVYNEEEIEDQNEVANNSYAFINERLQFLTAELSDSEGSIESFKSKNTVSTDVTANVGMYLSEFKENDSKLAQLDLQDGVIRNIESQLTSDKNTYELLPTNLMVDNANLTQQTDEYNNGIQERRRLLNSTIKEGHPLIRQIDDKLADAKIVMLRTIRNHKANMQKSVQALQAKNQQLQGKLRTIPSIERDLLEITRQKDIKEELYLYLLQKREESALTMAMTVSNARMIDAALPVGAPIEPKPRMIYTIAILLGLGLPFGMVLLANFLNDSVQSAEDIKQATAAPILGGISHSSTKKNIVVSKTSRSAIAEMFRMIRTNLQFLSAGQAKQTILVTSSTSGEGKTFITVNLGMSIALSGKKTVLVGFDLRKPKMIRYLEKEGMLQGISSYLIGEVDVEEIVLPSDIHPDLYYVPSGPIPPNPAELILQDRTKVLFDYLQENFDTVLIDTPPVGLVSDALLLNPYISASIFIVRYGQSKKGMLKLIDDLYQNKKLKNLSIIFNGIRSKGAYGSYGYGYGYGYGYYEEEAKTKRKRLFTWKK